MKKISFILICFVVLGVLLFTTACENEEMKETKYDYLVLVNKYTQLPDDWEKNVELVDAKNAWDEDIQVEKEAYEQYKKLAKALKEDGVEIVLDSVYRSVNAQQELWDEWSADPEKGIDYVRQYVAVPGYSEHHTGLAIDICLKKKGELVYENDDMIADRETFAKIHEKIADYGFILRYLEGRDEITGYAYEPWHLRYVGSKKIAREIMNKDITLEEYLDSIQDKRSHHSAAIYQIEKTLQDEFESVVYREQISNVRFNVTKVYTTEEIQKDKTMKSLKLGDQDLAFEVTYQLQPAEGVDPNELMIPDGDYDEELGWVKNISRLGVLKYNKKDHSYELDHFGTGW